MNNQEMPKSFIPQEEAEEVADEMKKVIRDRRRITEPVKASNQDYQEAYEKVDRDREIKEREDIENIEAREIQEIFDAVLFDWDGVLFDSMEAMAKGAVEVCKNFGVEIDEEKFLTTYDQPYKEWYERLGIPASNENAHQYIRCLYHNEIMPLLNAGKPSALFVDSIDTILELKKRGIKVGIVSAGTQEDIKKVLEENKIESSIDYFVARADKKIEAIDKICKENNLDPNRVLMIGDLPSDLRDAKAAGIKVAGLARFGLNEDKIGSYDPDYLLGGLGDEMMTLTPYIDKYLEK